MNSRTAVAVALGGLALAAFVVVGAGSGLIVDALWFRHLGYGVVFRTMLGAKLAAFAAGVLVAFGVIAAAGLYVAARGVEDGVVRVVLRRGNGAETLPELIAPFSHRIPWRGIALGVAALAAILFGLGQAANWQTYLLWRYGLAFGSSEPFFGRDVGFYVFALPAYRAALDGALGIVVLAGMAAAALYWAQGVIDLRRPGDPLPASAIRLLSALLGVFLLLRAASYWLGRYEFLFASYGAVYGPGYTVSHVKLPLQTLAAIAALAGAGLSFANLWVRGWRLPVVALVLVFATSLATSVVPDVYQRLRVRPDELRLEHPYLEHNIELTRLAYGLDKIQSRPFPAATPLDAAAIERNEETFRNVRLWDPGPLLDSYRQLQVIRLYYDFHDIDVDRYDLPNGRRQVMLAAREIVPSLLPENARTWVNQRLQFTHGFGAVMSPVTEFQSEGLPAFFLHDIPPQSPVGLRIDEPRIYFGERTDDYVFVAGAAEEFDYPKGDQNVANRYQGQDGVAIGSWLRRLVFAWHFGDVNLLISGNLRPESRILFRRSIRQRLSRLAPFLRLDNDPYLVVAAGRLQWVQDAYTTASTFPYAEPVPGLGFNYVRNPVKIVMDAYDGTVTFYAVDEKEPLLAAFARAFPGMFRPLAEMPQELRRHLRYPEGLFLIQAEMYRTYHMTNADVFYNKEDLWSFPSETVGATRSAIEPYYILMRLPGGERRGVLADAADDALQSQQHGGMAGGTLRRAALRRARRVRVPEGAGDLRAATDRGAHRSGHDDLAAALAVEPDGLEGDPRQPAGDPDRRRDRLRGAALPSLRAGTDPRAEAGDRRLRRSRRHGRRRSTARWPRSSAGRRRLLRRASRLLCRGRNRRSARPSTTTVPRSTACVPATGQPSGERWTRSARRSSRERDVCFKHCPSRSMPRRISASSSDA